MQDKKKTNLVAKAVPSRKTSLTMVVSLATMQDKRSCTIDGLLSYVINYKHSGFPFVSPIILKSFRFSSYLQILVVIFHIPHGGESMYLVSLVNRSVSQFFLCLPLVRCAT